MREEVEFDAHGTCLRGWLYLPPQGVPPHPAIAMAHGLSAVKEQGLDDYAAVFAAAGFAVLVYDNRNLGASDGLPRGEVDPVAQRRDYGHALTFLAARPDIDATRLGLWGTSYSGGLAIIAGALDRRVRCVVSQVPFLHGLRTLALTRSDEERRQLAALVERERLALAAGNPPSYVTVCDDDPARPVDSPGRLSHAWFTRYRPPGGLRWENRLTVISLAWRDEYDALSFVPWLAPTPLLLVVADDDRITPTSLALEAYALAREPKRLELIPGHHYAPYVEAFARASGAARDFFVEHLRERRA